MFVEFSCSVPVIPSGHRIGLLFQENACPVFENDRKSLKHYRGAVIIHGIYHVCTILRYSVGDIRMVRKKRRNDTLWYLGLVESDSVCPNNKHIRQSLRQSRLLIHIIHRRLHPDIEWYGKVNFTPEPVGVYGLGVNVLVERNDTPNMLELIYRSIITPHVSHDIHHDVGHILREIQVVCTSDKQVIILVEVKYRLLNAIVTLASNLCHKTIGAFQLIQQPVLCARSVMGMCGHAH